MGHTTDFIGHIDIFPPLNEAEAAYLSAFGSTRRYDREAGPYAVPGNPAAERDERPDDTDRYNRPGVGQPGLWCDWEPCWDGCCLAWNGHEKPRAMIGWLRYLIAHFLKAGARTVGRGPDFADFTYDHVLDGMLVGCRRDNKELFSITVSGNRVRERVLRPADQRYVDWPPLAYEAYIDESEKAMGRRPRPRPEGGTVIRLSPRSG